MKSKRSILLCFLTALLWFNTFFTQSSVRAAVPENARSCCSSDTTPSSEQKSCCQDAGRKHQGTCKGDCCENSCKCSVALTHFALPTASFRLERVYFYGCKKEFGPKTTHIHSTDFTAIWIPPKIIA